MSKAKSSDHYKKVWNDEIKRLQDIYYPKLRKPPKIIPNAQVSDEAKALFGSREPGSDG